MEVQEQVELSLEINLEIFYLKVFFQLKFQIKNFQNIIGKMQIHFAYLHIHRNILVPIENMAWSNIQSMIRLYRQWKYNQIENQIKAKAT